MRRGLVLLALLAGCSRAGKKPAVKRNGGAGTFTLTAIWATGSLGGAVIELSIPSKSPRPEAGYAKLGAVLGDVTDFDPGGSFAAMRR